MRESESENGMMVMMVMMIGRGCVDVCAAEARGWDVGCEMGSTTVFFRIGWVGRFVMGLDTSRRAHTYTYTH